MDYSKIAVLIPAYKPDERLIKLTDDLIAAGFRHLVVIDDGGGEKYAPIFAALEGKAQVLTHEVNRGKGAGLKTGIAEIMKSDAVGIVTADCDGQHTPQDVKKIADALLAHPDSLILGSRNIREMPLRSKAGNTLTCFVFAALTGLKIGDTQTGLRGLPKDWFETFLKLDGDRYEYEINMLMSAGENKIPVVEVEIATIYIDNNSSSHFNALKDGLRIYKLMFRQAGKFCLSSLISALIDYVMFILFDIALGWEVAFAQIGARIISSLANYFMNTKLVFKGKVTAATLIKYYVLAACILLCSIGGLKLLTGWGIPNLVAKIIVDAILYIVSYKVQQTAIYKK